MTLRLTIDETRFGAHVGSLHDAVANLVPVVKGNGYGIGRAELTRRAARRAEEIAVGTVHEAAQFLQYEARAADVLVLTPALHLPVGDDERSLLPPNAVLTVGHDAHLAALVTGGWTGRVAVKLASSMHRYGASVEECARLVGLVDRAGLEVHRFVLHTPLLGEAYTETDALGEIEAWLEHLDPRITLSVSHLTIPGFQGLVARHPERRFNLRAGTALWHGDKSFLHLTADVVDVRPVEAGGRAGYRSATVERTGSLVMIGAGSAHGVGDLPGGLSPFHHHRRRLALLEAPHMHTSMAMVPAGHPVPEIGEWVDVQRPLIGVVPDEVLWR